MSEPRRVHHQPLSDQQREDIRLRAEQLRAEFKAKRDAQRPDRLAALHAGPPLQDLEAAADCHCSCHPRPAGDQHDGGTTCPCQLSPAQRAERTSAALARLRGELRTVPKLDRGQQLRQLESELDITIISCGGMAPFQLDAMIDRRAVYVRERHGEYSISVAVEDNQPFDHNDYVIIDEGSEHSLYGPGNFDETHAVRYATAIVRRWLTSQRCAHEPGRNQAHRYCSLCGSPLDGGHEPADGQTLGDTPAG